MSKISVIIPVYNVEKYLEECIDSVLKQTYRDFEIILVDDGSTDSSGDICDRYALKDERIRVIHKENAGLSSARNVGFDMASGEYVYFLDSDDYIANNMLKKAIETIDAEKCDFVFFKAISFEDDTGKTSTENYDYHRDYSVGNPLDFFKEMTDNNEFHMAVWLMFFKKSFLKDKDLYFKEGIIYEDCIFSFKVYCLAEKAAHINENLYFRRYRTGSLIKSRVNEKYFLSIVEVYNEVIAFCDEKSLKTDYISRIAFRVIDNYFLLNNNTRKKFRKEYAIIKKDIQSRNAFDNKELKYRCYGKIPWFIYKCIEKVFG